MKSKTVFTCQNCAIQLPKWLGKCPECQSWSTIVEETYHENNPSEDDAKGHAVFRATLSSKDKPRIPQKLNEIQEEHTQRMKTSFGELDRVLGGGIVPGSLILIGGDPGIGKSTILMQALQQKDGGKAPRILYISGEESAHQIKLRAQRLQVRDDEYYIFAENQFEEIVESIKKLKPQILIIDSIQTIFSTQIQSAPGSVSQVRECTAKLMTLAKTLNIATFIVGHVTKDGAIAGPKVLEHMVDTVLYFEGSTHNAYRILRAVKNRFGSTNEIGVFEMLQSGLQEVRNASEIFLQERPVNAAGTAVVCILEGSRPILVEIQALVSATNLGNPRRTTLGIDHNKVSLLVAVIEKKLDLPLYGHDIFVNVAGGIKLTEPAADLGVGIALISSFRNKPIHSKLLICGEVGLTGEVRRISQLELRLAEAQRLGFEKAIVPKASLDALEKTGALTKQMKASSHGVRTLQEAIDVAFDI